MFLPVGIFLKNISYFRSDHSIDLAPIWMKMGIKYENDKLLVLGGMHFEEYKKLGIDLGISDVPYLLVS